MYRPRPLVFAAVLLGVAPACSDPAPDPAPATCRRLADSPALYAGRLVRVTLRGCERHAERSAVWRREPGGAPAVRIDWPRRAPDPLPASAVGTCHAPLVPGAPVTVRVRAD